MLLVAAVIAIVSGIALLAVPLGGPAPSPAPGSVVQGPGLLDRLAPDIDLEVLDSGGRERLADLRGRPVIVNFWASWCIPCRDEFPLLVAAYAEHRDEGLGILGVIHDDAPEPAAAFADHQGATWPMLLDPDDVAWSAYRAVGVPTTYFIDRDGIVRAFSLGPLTASGLAADLERILPVEPHPT
jgi:cytochrome c biogenesis protein CcmG/thiol:disulfide interchange protein DsbE